METVSNITKSRSARRWESSVKSRNRYASERREALVAALLTELTLADATQSGFGHCAACGHSHPISDLEIDHVNGVQWDGRRVSAWARAARYWREYNAGVRLRPLCRSCNGRDGARRRVRRK